MLLCPPDSADSVVAYDDKSAIVLRSLLARSTRKSGSRIESQFRQPYRSVRCMLCTFCINLCANLMSSEPWQKIKTSWNEETMKRLRFTTHKLLQTAPSCHRLSIVIHVFSLGLVQLRYPTEIMFYHKGPHPDYSVKRPGLQSSKTKHDVHKPLLTVICAFFEWN